MDDIKPVYKPGQQFAEFILLKFIKKENNKETWRAKHIKTEKEIELNIAFENSKVYERVKAFADTKQEFKNQETKRDLFKSNSKFGNYILLKYIGSGATGQTWLVQKNGSLTKSVLKINTSDLKESIDSFKNEILILNKAKNIPGVIKILDSGKKVINNQVYMWFTMPYVEPFMSKINYKLSIEKAISLFLHYFDIISVLKKNNILYTDYRLEHLCLHNNFPVIIDFGSAFDSSKKIDKEKKEYSEKLKRLLHKEFFTELTSKMKLKSDALLDFCDKSFSDIESYFLKNSSEEDRNYYYSIYFARKEYKKAEVGLKELIKENPQNMKALISLSKVYYAKNDFENSLEIIKKAYKVSNDDLEILFHIGLLYQIQDDFKTAIKYYNKFLEISPNNINILDKIGFCQQSIDSQKIDKKIERVDFKKINISSDDKNELLSVYKDNYKRNPLIGYKNRIYIQDNKGVTISNSYNKISWDQYFDDLSQGSYRVVYTKEKRAYRPRAWYYIFKHFHILEKIFSIKKDKIYILDIGCSSGYLLRLLEGNYSLTDNKKIYYFGLDIRDNVLKRAVFSKKEDLETPSALYNIPASFIRHDVKEDLPFKNEMFDAVVNLEMIKYLPVDQGEKLLNEINRVLKQNSFAYISTTHRKSIKGYIEGLTHKDFVQKINESGLKLQKTSGSQVDIKDLFSNVKPEHEVIIKQLLEYYPPEIVSAFFIPLYPDIAMQVLYFCEK